MLGRCHHRREGSLEVPEPVARDEAAEQQEQARVERAPGALTNEKVIVAGLLFALALLLRAVVAGRIPFPLDPDDAYYISVARRLLGGHGFTVNAVWNYLTGVPDSLPVPSSTYWGPLVPMVLWGMFAVVGDSWRAAQAAAGVFGASLVVCTYFFVLRQARNEAFALLAAVGTMLNATMIQSSTSPGTAIFYGVLLFFTLAMAGRVVGDRPRWALLAGACGGLLSLARNDGSLALVTLGILCLVFRRQGQGKVLVRLAALAAGFIAVRVPWELYSLLVTGAPPGGGQIRVAFLTSYAQIFTTHPERLTLSHLLRQSLTGMVGARVGAMGGNFIEVATQVGVVTFILAVAATIKRRREPALAAIGTHYLVLFFFTALLFPYPTRQGTFGHAFTGMIPLVVGAAFIALCDWEGGGRARAWRRSTAWALTLFMMAMYLATLGRSIQQAEAASRKRQGMESYAAAALEQLNPEGRIILHYNAWDYYYLTTRPVLMLPGDEYSAIVALARRFRTPFLVANTGMRRYHPGFLRGSARDVHITLVPESAAPVQIFRFLYPECLGKRLDRLELARAHSRAGIALDRAADRISDQSWREANRKGAEVELRKAAILAPEVPDAHYNLALVLEGLGKTSEATAEAETALRLRPGDAKAAELLRRLRQGAGADAFGGGGPRG